MKAARRNNALTAVCLFLILLIFSARAGLTDGRKYRESIAANSEKTVDLSDVLTGEYYYCTPSGAKYHFDENCRYLKSSKEIEKSDRYYLESETREPCSACTVAEPETAPEASQETTQETTAAKTETVYYYTPKGKKYHLDKNCRYLKNSKEILECGELTGKDLTPCSACAQ